MGKKNSFFGGAAVLAMGIAVVKVIGAIFKIPIVRILGNTGYANFSDAYNIYAVLLTISTAGLPVALSKMVAAAYALDRERQARKTFRVSLMVFFSLGFVSFLVMFFGADWLAGLMNNPFAAQAIRFLAPAVVCVSCLSSFRGFAQGRSNMVPSAVSQIIEAVGKLVIGLPLAAVAVHLGQAPAQTAAWAIFGVTMGSALALGYMILQYFHSRGPAEGSPETTSGKSILRELLSIAIPITLTSSAVSIINLIDSSLVKGRLQDALGYAVEESLELYGSYVGVMTVYNLPSSFIIAVTASIIPAVSAALAAKKDREASRVVRASYHLTALLVFPMGVGISVLSQPIVQLLFHPSDPARSGGLLAILGIASIFVCLTSVSHSIMQAYGYQHLPILVMLAGGITMIIIDYNLVAIPAVNIFGSPIGTLCCFALATTLDFIILRRIVPHPPKFLRLFFGPLFATSAMALVAWGVHWIMSRFAGNLLSTLAAILAAVAVYAFLVIFLKLLSREELKLMPKGDKIADLLKLP